MQHPLGKCHRPGRTNDAPAGLPNSEICCDQFLFSGGSTSECTPVSRAGHTPCDYGERCAAEGSACRIPGTVCVNGHCRKPVSGLTCGGSACPERIECTRDADCIPGQRCVFEPVTTWCARFVPEGYYAKYLCERPSDCPTKGCAVKPVCVESGVPGLRHCDCSQPS